jgi:glycosyltransferase involved in cell wall biosynthesis
VPAGPGRPERGGRERDGRERDGPERDGPERDGPGAADSGEPPTEHAGREGSGQQPAELPPGRKILRELGDTPLVAHFGIVDPAKQPMLLIDAFARVRPEAPRAKLAFVGPAAESLSEQMRARCDEHGLGDSVILTGAVPAREFRALVERATVAVQLRSRFNGEASAAVGQCMACGVPTVVSDLGWMGELPDAAVVKVPPDVSPESLARAVLDLLAEPSRRESLGWAAREVARRQGFEVTAQALLEVFEQLSPAV